MSEPCPHAPSKWVGIVTNSLERDPIPTPHASVSVCHREVCHDRAWDWVYAHTHQPPRFYTYEEIRNA